MIGEDIEKIRHHSDCVHYELCRDLLLGGGKMLDDKVKCDYYMEKPKQGEWIVDDFDEYYGRWYKCSICGHVSMWGNFCPNCGSRNEKGSVQNEN